MSNVTVDWTHEQERFMDHGYEPVRRAAMHAFRGRPDRDDLAMDAIARAWESWRCIVTRGEDPISVGVHAIARNSVLNVASGRRFAGSGNPGSAGWEIMHRRSGYARVDLPADAWMDPRVTPADVAASKIDFESWIGTLADRDRGVLLALAIGHQGKEVAARYGISRGRVSQIRSAAETSWRSFSGVA
jgi:DNA-directed RNA polymerase specialized sigma24 family protein